MKPYDAKSEKHLLNMESDNFGPGGEWSILHNGEYVSLHAPSGGYVSIPLDQFNAIVDWYTSDQPTRRKGA